MKTQQTNTGNVQLTAEQTKVLAEQKALDDKKKKDSKDIAIVIGDKTYNTNGLRILKNSDNEKDIYAIPNNVLNDTKLTMYCFDGTYKLVNEVVYQQIVKSRNCTKVIDGISYNPVASRDIPDSRTTKTEVVDLGEVDKLFNGYKLILECKIDGTEKSVVCCHVVAKNGNNTTYVILYVALISVLDYLANIKGDKKSWSNYDTSIKELRGLITTSSRKKDVVVTMITKGLPIIANDTQAEQQEEKTDTEKK